MKIPTIPAFAAALFFLLPCTAAAQEDPEAVYAKFHRALHAGDLDEIYKYTTVETKNEIASQAPGQLKGWLQLMKVLEPQTYTVTAREPSADGNELTIRATAHGMTMFGEKPEPLKGAIQMRKQGGVWKLYKSSWQGVNQAPATPPAPKSAAKSAPQIQPAPASRTAPKPPERVVGKAKEPCVYKSVMTNEDMERCR